MGLVHAEARRRGDGEIVDDAMKPFFERRGSEVDEQADGEVHQAEISQDLLAVDGREFFHGLELHDHATFHD